MVRSYKYLNAISVFFVLVLLISNVVSSDSITKATSFDMFKEGKTISEIAKIRELSPGTIESYLAFYILDGKIKVNDLIPLNKIQHITAVIKEYGDYPLSPLKELLGDSVSYGEIRAVINHLKISGN